MISFKSSADIDLPHRIILSISSDFGIALADAWLDRGIKVSGTFRTMSPACERLRAKGAHLIKCDLSDAKTVEQAVAELRRNGATWDVLVVAPATQEPVGLFFEGDYDAWQASVEVNFVAQLRVIHGLMPARRIGSERAPIVLFFAGGGTNNATINYSAYTISKIASIKMVELLDAEVPDTRFSIVGPGWVKTKIHQPTVELGAAKAGSNYERTVRMLASDDCVPLERVVECCDWIIGAPREAVGGRNISLVYDCWDDPKLLEMLAADRDMYKLRRSGNDKLVRGAAKAAEPGPGEMLARVIECLPELAAHHSPFGNVYRALATAARNSAVPLYGPGRRGAQPFGRFGTLVFPYFTLGAIDTLDFFGLDELIIFSFYWANRQRYKRVADVGANIGLHSLVLSRCGYTVHSYEPDPKHVALFKETIAANKGSNIELFAAAVSDHVGEAEFVRVLGNTTGSHLAGAKPNPYGPLERFNVPLMPFSELMEWADFMKVDAEGHEATMLLSTTAAQWEGTDVLLEIGSEKNAEIIFQHCQTIGVNIFSQKLGWCQAHSVADVPHSYKEGSAFITRRAGVPGFTVV